MLQILKTSNTPQSLIDTYFIKEAEKYLENSCNAETKVKIMEWANEVVTRKHSYSFSVSASVALVNTIVKLNDSELIQKLIQNGAISSPEVFSSIVKECDRLGWEQFATSTVALFKQMERKSAIKCLNLFYGDGNLKQEKNELFSALLQGILAKEVVPKRYMLLNHDQTKQQNEDKEMLEPLVNAVLQMNDPRFLEKFVKCIVPLHSETIPLLVTMCEKYGWGRFATIIADKFKTKSMKDRVICLTALIQNGILDGDKKTLCLNLFGVLFENNEVLINDLSFYSPAADNIKRQKYEKELLEPFINCAAMFNDVQLIKNIFERMALHSETIPLLVNQSKIYGWSAFITEITGMFEKLSQIDAIDTLYVLIGINDFKQDKNMSFNLFQMILDKSRTLSENNILRITQQEISKYLKGKQEILYSICRVAENIKFSLVTFAKSQSFKDFGPVLLRLVQKETNRLSTFWAAVAMHFIAEMGKESIKPIEISWRHSTNSFYRCCSDCISLNNFLGSEKEHAAFKMGENRRKHLQQRVNAIEKMSHRTELGARGQVGVLIVTKTEMGGADAIKDKQLSRALLDQLRPVLPYN